MIREAILRSDLRRLGRAVAQLAADLEEGEDFPTQTASELCQIIRKTATLMADRIDDAPADKLLHIHTFLVMLGADLRYPERSRTEETPWSIVQATETFLKAHVTAPCRFIIRPQWSYNYGLLGGLIESYTTDINSLSEWISVSDWKKEVGCVLTDPIYCVSFPRIERMNILSHVNWGHEVGHILASQWLESRFKTLWALREGAIRKRLEEHHTKAMPVPLGIKVPKNMLNDIVRERVAEAVKETMHLTRTALKELISDAIGVHLFGPATLASLAEFSCHSVMDANPLQTRRYPPWRFRLRTIAEAVVPALSAVNKINWHHILGGYVDWIEKWYTSVEEKPEQTVFDSDIRLREAYRLVGAAWKGIWRQVLSKLPKGKRQPYILAERQAILEELIERLRHGIPPNEIGNWPNNEAASLPDIWNAAWAYKIQLFRGDKGPVFDDHLGTISKLTLKAIEASYVQTTFGPSLKGI